jgi:hypothetical protein
MRLTFNAEVRVDRPEQIEELVRLAANAEIGLTVFEKTGDASETENEPRFRLDRDRAAHELGSGDGAITVVNAYSDADEYHGLIDAAQGAGIIARRDPRSQIYIYPMSLSEPDPMVAVDGGPGPTRLAFASTPCEREGETPVAFTLRFLEEVVCAANSLLAR